MYNTADILIIVVTTFAAAARHFICFKLVLCLDVASAGEFALKVLDGRWRGEGSTVQLRLSKPRRAFCCVPHLFASHPTIPQSGPLYLP